MEKGERNFKCKIYSKYLIPSHQKCTQTTTYANATKTHAPIPPKHGCQRFESLINQLDGVNPAEIPNKLRAILKELKSTINSNERQVPSKNFTLQHQKSVQRANTIPGQSEKLHKNHLTNKINPQNKNLYNQDPTQDEDP